MVDKQISLSQTKEIWVKCKQAFPPPPTLLCCTEEGRGRSWWNMGVKGYNTPCLQAGLVYADIEEGWVKESDSLVIPTETGSALFQAGENKTLSSVGLNVCRSHKG